MSPAPLLSLDTLTKQHQIAVEAWRSQTSPSALFEAWSQTQASWAQLEGNDESRWTGHIAVLWQDLNAECDGLESLPLLNQFIRVRFRGIQRKTPVEFKPELPAGEALWHSALQQCLVALREQAAPEQERLVDALLAQYAAVYSSRLPARALEVLQHQVPQLALAQQLGQSSLYRLSSLEGEAQYADIIDLLAWLRTPPPATDSLEQLLTSGALSPADAEQLFGLWATHCPWFGQFLSRHRPEALLPPSRQKPAALEALRCGGRCDLGVMLVAAARTARHWLLSCEAMPESAVSLTALPDTDIETSRATWQADGQGEQANHAPGLFAQCRASKLLQLTAWEIPIAYFSQSAESGQQADSPRDASLVHRSREALDAQPLCAGLALLPALALDSSGHSLADLQPYLHAADLAARQLRAAGSDPAGFAWCIVFDRPQPIQWAPAYAGGPTPDARLEEEYGQALRGTYPSAAKPGHQPLLQLAGANSEALVLTARRQTACRRSPAFAARVCHDLRSIAPFLDRLLELQFASISVTYTDSSHTEVGQWPALAATWEYLKQAAERATALDRCRGVEQRLVADLNAVAPATNLPAGQSETIGQLLEKLGEIDGDSKTRSRSTTNRYDTWQQLEKRVGKPSPLTPGDFEHLWKDGEERHRHLKRGQGERAECLRSIVTSLLAELGIPTQELSHFAETRHVYAASGIPPAEDEWEAVLQLAEKPHPLEEGSLGALRPLHTGYDAVGGSTSHHCILKDFGPDQPTAALLNEYRFQSIVDVLFLEDVDLRAKTRLALSLRGHSPDKWRQCVTMSFGEKNNLKREVLGEIWREVLQADLALVYLLCMTVQAGMTMARHEDPAESTWRHRRSQVLNLLSAGGWAPEAIAQDIPGSRATLLRIIDLWKDYYRHRGVIGAKKRTARVESLRSEYAKLRKPLEMPELNADLGRDRAERLERSVYVAAHCTELLQRIANYDEGETPAAKNRDGSIDVRAVSQRFRGQAQALITDYNQQKSRYFVRRAAFELVKAEWLRGFGPSVELVGSDVLAQSHQPPARLAGILTKGVQAALQLHREALKTPAHH